MRKALFAAVAAFGLAAAAPAWSAPICSTTITAVSGTPLTGLIGGGTCVAAGDKIFGNFAVSGGLTGGTGSATFTFGAGPGPVTIAFLGNLTAGLTGVLDYSVAVDPLLSNGFLIVGIEKDFTMNTDTQGSPASAELLGVTIPGNETSPPINIDCTRTVNPQTSTCPQDNAFAPVASLDIQETVIAGTHATVTALTDTLFQAPPSVPEPASLGLLGVGLLGLAFVAKKRQ